MTVTRERKEEMRKINLKTKQKQYKPANASQYNVRGVKERYKYTNFFKGNYGFYYFKLSIYATARAFAQRLISRPWTHNEQKRD